MGTDVRSYLVNIAAVLTSLLTFLAYETGALLPQNAFFLAAAIVVLYTGYQLAVREGSHLLKAAKDIVWDPSSYPRRTAYAAYIGSLALGFLIIAQSVTTSA